MHIIWELVVIIVTLCAAFAYSLLRIAAKPVPKPPRRELLDYKRGRIEDCWNESQRLRAAS